MGDISANFDRAELVCRCDICIALGDAAPIPTSALILALQNLRDECGYPIRVSRGITCEHHNAEIGGAADSRHLPQHGDAVDVACGDSGEAYELVQIALNLEDFRFIEVAPKHIHLDMRPGPYRLIVGVDK